MIVPALCASQMFAQSLDYMEQSKQNIENNRILIDEKKSNLFEIL